MKTNIRKISGCNNEYCLINREERNLSAIFYHLLLINDNLDKFLHKINCSFPINKNELCIYFEYAYVRDIWYEMGVKQDTNEKKRNLILKMLQPSNQQELERMSVGDFNKYFGGKSKQYIESPRNWSMKEYNKTIIDNDEFLKTCKFKWSFSTKPDIVIHLSNDTAICIEAKFESSQSSYPSNDKEKKIFNDRKISRIGQFAMQKFLMEEMLGITTEYVILSKKQINNLHTEKVFKWKEIFEIMDFDSTMPFVKKWIDNFIYK